MPRKTLVTGFTHAGTSHHTRQLAEYLDYVNHIPEVREIKERSYQHLHLKEGDAVLDPGCGSGYDAIHMAGMVGRGGRVLGIDLNEQLVGLARRNVEGLDLPVSFEVKDISRSDLPDNSFNAIRIERTLQVINDPGRVLDELVRMLSHSGWLVALEPDWDTFVIDPGSHDTAGTFFRFCHNQFPDGSTGRKLYRYFRERELKNVRVYPEPLVMHDLEPVFRLLNMDQFLAAAEERGAMRRDAIVKWQAEMRSAGDVCRFTFAGLIFVVSGQK